MLFNTLWYTTVVRTQSALCYLRSLRSAGTSGILACSKTTRSHDSQCIPYDNKSSNNDCQRHYPFFHPLRNKTELFKTTTWTAKSTSVSCATTVLLHGGRRSFCRGKMTYFATDFPPLRRVKSAALRLRHEEQ